MIGGVIEPVMMTSPAASFSPKFRQYVGDMGDDIRQLAGHRLGVG